MRDIKGLSLPEALDAYIHVAKNKRGLRAHQDLARFQRWCGEGLTLSRLNPTVVSEYAEFIATSTPPDDARKQVESVREFLSFAQKQGYIELNLAQHARYRSIRAKGSLRQRKKAPLKVHLTLQGRVDLENRLSNLKEESILLSKEIKRAAADKDFRENAPLDAVRENKGQVDSKILEIEAVLRAALELDPSKSQAVPTIALGATVRLRNLNTKQEVVYQVVSPIEANILDGKISSESPVGQAILHQEPGHEIEVSAPIGTQRYVIVGIVS